MKTVHCFTLLLALALSGQAIGAAQARQLAVAPYMRIDESRSNRVELQIALRRLVPDKSTNGPAIWLAAVAHIGETNYFRRLQKHLSALDLVLFEAVLPERKGGWSGRQFAAIRKALPEVKEEAGIQTDLAHSLGLAFQLEAIDYDQPNYRNSDLSIQGIQRLMMPPGYRPARPGEKPDKPPADSAGDESENESNESFNQLMQMMEGKGFLGGLVKFGVAMIAANPRLQAVTRLTFIEVLGGLKGDLAGTQAVPPEMARLLKALIHGRNQKVVDDLRRTIQRPTPPKSIGVFYGAGHMDDLERRIRTQLGYRPAEDLWLPAFAVDLEKHGISQWERGMIRLMTQRQLQLLNARTEEPGESGRGGEVGDQ